MKVMEFLQSVIAPKLEKLEGEIAGLKGNMEGMEKGLKGEIAGLRGSVEGIEKELKAEIGGLKGSVEGIEKGLKGEIAEARGEVAGLKSEIKRLEGKIDNVSDKLEIFNVTEKLRERISELEKKVGV